MSTCQLIPLKPAPATLPSFIPVRNGLLQRKCACGGTPGPTGECEECRKKRLQRATNHQSTLKPEASFVPPIVDKVLRSPYRPPDFTTRPFKEPQFGHDFGQVRVYSDARAAERRIDKGEGMGMEDLPVPMKGDGKKEPAKPEEKPVKAEEKAAKCPTQTVTMSGAKCGSQYGAIGKYCYSGAKEWWFKENVVMGAPNTCVPGASIDQTATPFQATGNCVADDISNFNGPPKNVAPCEMVTEQTVFTGPTKADVEKCQYKNKQVIKVTAAKDGKSGKVTTSSAGVSTSCDWS
jgi:hypothetical protein